MIQIILNMGIPNQIGPQWMGGGIFIKEAQGRGTLYISGPHTLHAYSECEMAISFHRIRNLSHYNLVGTNYHTQKHQNIRGDEE